MSKNLRLNNEPSGSGVKSYDEMAAIKKFLDNYDSENIHNEFDEGSSGTNALIPKDDNDIVMDGNLRDSDVRKLLDIHQNSEHSSSTDNVEDQEEEQVQPLHLSLKSESFDLFDDETSDPVEDCLDEILSFRVPSRCNNDKEKEGERQEEPEACQNHETSELDPIAIFLKCKFMEMSTASKTHFFEKVRKYLEILDELRLNFRFMKILKKDQVTYQKESMKFSEKAKKVAVINEELKETLELGLCMITRLNYIGRLLNMRIPYEMKLAKAEKNSFVISTLKKVYRLIHNNDFVRDYMSTFGGMRF